MNYLKFNKLYFDYKVQLFLLFCVFTNIQGYLTNRFVNLWFFNLVDECLIISIYVLVLFYAIKISYTTVLFVMILPVISILYGVIINYYNGWSVNWFVVIAQSFINVKFFIYFIPFYLFSISTEEKVDGVEMYIMNVVFLVSLVGAGLSLVEPHIFSVAVGVHEIERTRLIGFQFKPNDLAIFLSLYYSVILFDSKKTWLKYVLMMLAFCTVIYSTSRTGLFVVIISTMFCFLRLRMLKYLLFFATAIILILSYDKIKDSFFITETIRNFSEFFDIERSRYIRFIMLYLGFDIALDNFPIGVGPGNFGTVLSENSPVYYLIGVSSMSFFEELKGIYDSNIASILGEYGFLGLTFFLYISYRVFKFFAKGNLFYLSLFFSISIVIALFQPFYSYHVNAINMLLFMLTMKRLIKETV
ncbi:O-antigen ligase family protein [Vibrio sp. JC009]|uniref:O-antigen ligase family protein n=1 Tax=Vibrio sp. JC009 TaxID=2912314 RepID=UPI0023B159B6|nr:O-antigen ligase family protein [Vibrio sp. JC009]WED20642.1 O-antigen ligase family protein [Vibrio sp. JC009]